MNGLIGKKIGMTQVYNTEGVLIPVTVLEVGPCVVTQVKTIEKDGYTAIQLGFGINKKPTKPLKNHSKDLSVVSKHIKEFRLDKVDGINRGQEFKADLLEAGEYVVISGTSIGKGTAGTIRRWNFARGDMTHGSKSHRLPGSIGAGTTPARVFKGQKMAGRMGNEKVTQKNILVVSVDVEKNMVLVKGAVPGSDSGIVTIVKSGDKLKGFIPVSGKKEKKKEDKGETRHGVSIQNG